MLCLQLLAPLRHTPIAMEPNEKQTDLEAPAYVRLEIELRLLNSYCDRVASAELCQNYGSKMQTVSLPACSLTVLTVLSDGWGAAWDVAPVSLGVSRGFPK